MKQTCWKKSNLIQVSFSEKRWSFLLKKKVDVRAMSDFTVSEKTTNKKRCSSTLVALIWVCLDELDWKLKCIYKYLASYMCANDTTYTNMHILNLYIYYNMNTQYIIVVDFYVQKMNRITCHQPGLLPVLNRPWRNLTTPTSPPSFSPLLVLPPV